MMAECYIKLSMPYLVFKDLKCPDHIHQKLHIEFNVEIGGVRGRFLNSIPFQSRNSNNYIFAQCPCVIPVLNSVVNVETCQ